MQVELLAKVDTVLSGVYSDYLKFFRYLGIGIISTLVDWAIFYMLIGSLGVFYMLALAISYLISTVISFFLNKRYTFRNTYKKVHFQLASFVAVAIAGLAINEAIVYGLAHYVFGSNASLALMAARVIATFIAFVWNFMINKRVTFQVFQ